MIVQVKLDIADEATHQLISAAYREGYKRVEPRKSWTPRELKDAIRYLTERLIEKEVPNQIQVRERS